MKRGFWMAFMLAAMLLGNLTTGRAQTFEYLRAPGALSISQLSRDGDFFAARLTTLEAAEAVLWSITDGWERLFPGLWGSANGVSADGSVVVGGVGDSAFVWRRGGTFLTFAPPSNAWSMNDAGNLFILWRNYGALRDLTSGADLKVWPSQGTGSAFTAQPVKLSRDGSTVIGYRSGSRRDGFVDRVGGGSFNLPNYAFPQAVSADGAWVAGPYHDGTLWQTFLWSASTGFRVLPQLPGPPITQGNTTPRIAGVWVGVGGPRVVGMVRVANDDPEAGWYGSEGERFAAVIWVDPELPPQYLRQYFQNVHQLQGDPIYPLGVVYDVSADGNVIVGNSVVGGPWRAELATTASMITTPELHAISPETVAAGGDSFTLRTEGRGFRPYSVVQWNGSALPTTFISPTQLDAVVDASLIASPHGVQIAVNTPYPWDPNDGKRSNELTLTVGQGASPVISALSPVGVRAGSTAISLSVMGQNFTSQSQVEFDGQLLSSTFISPNELQANVPPELLENQGSFAVRVYEPSLNDYSNTLSFVVTVAVPSISRITPTSVLEKPSSDVPLTVRGAGFQQDSRVVFSGLELPATFISSNELRAVIPKSQLATPGIWYLSVFNPSVGMYSNGVTFRVRARPVTPPPPPPGTGPGGSPSLQAVSASIAPNVMSQVFITIKNVGGGDMTGGRLTSATLSGFPTTLLPDPGLSGLGAGQSVQLIFNFMTPNIRSGQSFVIRVSGTSSQGSWSVSRIVTVP
ncbi:MAG: hypothetical protein K6U75_10345 [Firmicutes bacterium]|nr:hypothetical protein [Bacillota bacterium]